MRPTKPPMISHLALNSSRPRREEKKALLCWHHTYSMCAVSERSITFFLSKFYNMMKISFAGLCSSFLFYIPHLTPPKKDGWQKTNKSGEKSSMLALPRKAPLLRAILSFYSLTRESNCPNKMHTTYPCWPTGLI